MKKYLLMALSVLMATTFVACGDDDDDPVEEKTKEAIVDVYAPVFDEQFDYVTCTININVDGKTVATVPVEKGKYTAVPGLAYNPIEREVNIMNKELIKDIKYCKVFTGKYKSGTTVEATSTYALTGKYGSHETEFNMLVGTLVVATYGNIVTVGNTECRCFNGIYSDEENLKGLFEVFKNDKSKSSIVIQ